MWSCGVLLYFLLSCEKPFSGENIAQSIAAGDYKFEPNDVWDEISDAVKDLITNLLKVDPENRLTATEAFNHDWLEFTRNDISEVEKMLSKDKDNNEGVLKRKHDEEEEEEEVQNHQKKAKLG